MEELYNQRTLYLGKFINSTIERRLLILMKQIQISVAYCIEVTKMKFIKRECYLNRLINVIGTSDIKVITGTRGSEKFK